MHEQQHERPHAPRAPGQAFAGPRLELPKFQFSSSSSLARPGAHAPAPQPAPQPQHHQPAPVRYAQPQPHVQQFQHAQPQFQAPPVQYAPAHAAPVPTYQASATAMPHQPVAVTYAAPQPAMAAPAPRPAPRPMQRVAPTATATRPAASIAWDRIDSPGERSLLQRITPVHMGVLMVLVMVAMVASSGPAAMSVKPQRLPALVQGGGTAGDPLQPPRAGATAIEAARSAHASHGSKAAPKAPAPRVRARARANAAWIRVGNARVRRAVRSGGIPSPAASANLAVAGGGRVAAGSTDAVNLRGIPSPAAAENLGPKTLAYRPTDGVTLPRMVGERDSHALDSHYGRDTLPMEAPVASPALTPGAAAEQAQQRVILDELGASPATPVTGSGIPAGYISAY